MTGDGAVLDFCGSFPDGDGIYDILGLIPTKALPNFHFIKSWIGIFPAEILRRQKIRYQVASELRRNRNCSHIGLAHFNLASEGLKFSNDIFDHLIAHAPRASFKDERTPSKSGKDDCMAFQPPGIVGYIGYGGSLLPNGSRKKWWIRPYYAAKGTKATSLLTLLHERYSFIHRITMYR
jgi:hypothetical protein